MLDASGVHYQQANVRKEVSLKDITAAMSVECGEIDLMGGTPSEKHFLDELIVPVL